MARTIMVSDEVYEMLKKLKRPGESFSDVIKKLISRKGGLLEIAGSKTITEEGIAALKEYKRKVLLADIERLERVFGGSSVSS